LGAAHRESLDAADLVRCSAWFGVVFVRGWLLDHPLEAASPAHHPGRSTRARPRSRSSMEHKRRTRNRTKESGATHHNPGNPGPPSIILVQGESSATAAPADAGWPRISMLGGPVSRISRISMPGGPVSSHHNPGAGREFGHSSPCMCWVAPYLYAGWPRISYLVSLVSLCWVASYLPIIILVQGESSATAAPACAGWPRISMLGGPVSRRISMLGGPVSRSSMEHKRRTRNRTKESGATHHNPGAGREFGHSSPCLCWVAPYLYAGWTRIFPCAGREFGHSSPCLCWVAPYLPWVAPYPPSRSPVQRVIDPCTSFDTPIS